MSRSLGAATDLFSVFFRQLGNLCSFCGAEDVNRYIAPITLSLAIDRVCDVRIAAMHSVGTLAPLAALNLI